MTTQEICEKIRSPENWNAELFDEVEALLPEDMQRVETALGDKKTDFGKALASFVMRSSPDSLPVVGTVFSDDDAYKSSATTDLSESLKLSKTTGRALNLVCNYVTILRYDGFFRGRISQNELEGYPWVFGVYWNTEPHPLRDEDVDNIRDFIGARYEIDNTDNVLSAIRVIASDNRYHPIRRKLQSLQWDGVPRLQDLFPRYLGAEKTPFVTAITLTLFHGLIQRVFAPGVKFDYCVVLADARQGTGKSTMCRLLALEDEWFTDAVSSFEDSEKLFETIRGKWVVELSEMLATRRTKEVESIKSELSHNTDRYREKYGRLSRDYKRQCVFIGTTNKSEPLPDDKTGNRRFLLIECNGLKAERHPMSDENETRQYIEQCYAEAIEIGRTQGWQLTIPAEFDTELSTMQEKASPEDSRIGMIQRWLDETEETAVCALMVYDQVFNGGIKYTGDPNKIRTVKSDIIEILDNKIDGWARCKTAQNKKHFGERHGGYGQQVAWERVSRDLSSDLSSTPSEDGLIGFAAVSSTENVPF